MVHLLFAGVPVFSEFVIMEFKKLFILLFLIFVVLGCSKEDNNSEEGNNTDPNLAKITFFNESSHPVDIFKNFNPENPDSSTYIGTVDTLSRTLVVNNVPPSTDKFLGDTFYLRFKIIVENKLEAGTEEDIVIYAERTMSNIPLVIDSGKSYFETIADPPINELRFVNGILKVRNMTSGQVWIENNSAILPQKGRSAAWLAPSQFGFYELSLPFLAESWPMDNIKSRDNQTNRTFFPSFVLERGKIYSFEIKNEIIEGPVISNINPLEK